MPIRPETTIGKRQLLGRRRPVVGQVVGLGDDRVVHDHDQADAGSPLGRGDADLARAERAVGGDLEPRADHGRCPASPPAAGAALVWAGWTVSTFRTSPRSPGGSQSNPQAPFQFCWPEIPISTV